MQRIARRVGQRHADQAVEIGQIRPAGGGVHVEPPHVEGLRHGAVRGDVGVAGPQGPVERIGLGLVDVQQGAAGHLQGEGRLVQRALPVHLEPAVIDAQLLAGVDRPLEAQVPPGVEIGELTVGDHEVADRRQAERLVLVLAVRKVPRRPALGVAVETDHRMVELEQRQVNVAGEQRDQPDPYPDPVDRSEPARRRPGGVGDLDAADCGARLPGEGVNLEVAGDRHLAVHPRRGDAGQRPAEPVPVPDRGQDGGDHRQHQEHARRPPQAPMGTAALGLGRGNCLSGQGEATPQAPRRLLNA